MRTRHTLCYASPFSIAESTTERGGASCSQAIHLCTALTGQWSCWKLPTLSYQQGNQHVARFLDLVEMHYRVEHRPVEYARMLCLSPGQLRKSCRQAQGFPPLHFIQHRIGMGAVSLLAHSQLSIQEIAWELGFEDADYFSRFFHKKFLFTPTAFRRALAG